MAIDQESAPGESDLKLLRKSAIENEIPTYRAVSTRAVFAVICGLLAALSFAHPAFYLFALAAIVLGVWADRSIQARSDVLTGRGLARAGVAMGLVFGLSIYTFTTMRDYLAQRQAAAFAVEYAKQLKVGKLADLYWIGLTPMHRATVTPEDYLKQMQSQREDAAVNELKFAGLKGIVRDLAASPESAITFKGIENSGREDLNVVAIALYDVHVGAAKHEHKEGEVHEEGEAHEHKEGDAHDHGAGAGPRDVHAAAVIKGMVPEGKNAYEWWVEDVVYPYTPKTAALPEASSKPVDDGHGHAH